MKVLFLHLSDMHFEKDGDINETYIKQIASALSPSSIDPVGKIFIFFTGDIAHSGKKVQYICFNRFRHSLIQELKQSVLSTELIHIFMVPGNHDIDYTGLTRTRLDCESAVNEPSKYDFSDEWTSQKAFLNFSRLNFSLSPTCPFFRRSVVTLSDGFSIEINMINSTVFSLLHENDQGLHYLPEEVIGNLASPSGANMAITLMHHSHQWFNDSCKLQFEKALLEKNTMVFFGHEHYQTTQAISYNGKAAAHIFCGGRLCNRGDWSGSEFFACVYDTDDYSFQHYNFVWNEKESLYAKHLIQQGTLPSKFSNNIPQVCNQALVSSIMNDTFVHLSDNLADYYVFPGVTREFTPKAQTAGSFSADIFTLNNFYKEFETCQRIEVSGSDTYGKSALLKMVFNHYLTKKCVLYCKVEDISSGNRRRIIKSLFEELYGESEAAYQKFERLDQSEKMILIDDIHLINPKHVSSFLSGIEEEFGYIMYTTSNTIKLDIQERIKAAIATDSYTCFKLNPLYAPKRAELVEKVLFIKNTNSPTVEISQMTSRITQALDLQRRYVPLTPEIIIKFIEYFSTYQMESSQNDGSIFGKVFESSIINALSPHVPSPLTVDKVFMILGKVAYFAHKNKHYPVSDQNILSVITEYCEEYGGTINGVELIRSVLDSRIMNRCAENGMYKFCNNNYLAYFIAYEICNSENIDAVKSCLDHACFGIHSNILMFVTYITNKDSIVGAIMVSALSAVDGWEEFSFSMKELTHLNVARTYQLQPPSSNDIAYNKQQDLIKDRTEIENASFDIVNIYDYNEDDINTLENRLTRSISLMLLLARCLPNFEHRLKKSQKERIIKALYTLPNQIYHTWAIHVEQGKEELLELITSMEDNAFVRRKPTLEDAQYILQWNSLSLLLELYHGVVNCSYRENTAEFLTDMASTVVSLGDETHQLEYLLVLAKGNQITEFLSSAEKMKERCKLPTANLALTRVVHHVLLKDNLPPNYVAQIESKFFPNAIRSSTIYQRKIESKKK